MIYILRTVIVFLTTASECPLWIRCVPIVIPAEILQSVLSTNYVDNVCPGDVFINAQNWSNRYSTGGTSNNVTGDQRLILRARQ
ncbi:hypothetical protein EV127DRAFT_99433 [Xylaria flabelliformis]|nr:hypothetical protein EV127DRAFT_99433 [Xylaria flabelliformis]